MTKTTKPKRTRAPKELEDATKPARHLEGRFGNALPDLGDTITQAMSEPAQTM
jgi:hypothetical protein